MRIGLIFFLRCGINLLSYVGFSLALNVLITVHDSCFFGGFFVPFFFQMIFWMMLLICLRSLCFFLRFFDLPLNFVRILNCMRRSWGFASIKFKCGLYFPMLVLYNPLVFAIGLLLGIVAVIDVIVTCSSWFRIIFGSFDCIGNWQLECMHNCSSIMALVLQYCISWAWILFTISCCCFY